jgi:hypothetical protein
MIPVFRHPFDDAQGKLSTQRSGVKGDRASSREGIA